MAGQTVTVSVLADTKRFSSSMKQLADETGLTKIAERAKEAGTALAAMAASAVLAVGAVATRLIKAGEAAAVSNARIGAIAEQMQLFGDGARGVTERLVKLAEATARNTGIDQNAIKATQAKLLTFKEIAKSADVVGGSFDRATQAAIDLQAAGFGSAEQAAVQLGKALNDPVAGVSALTEVGLTFTAAEKEQIAAMQAAGDMAGAQNLILAAIEVQVGNTAAATATATSKMKVGFSQLEERLGQKLLPTFNRVTAFFLDKGLPALERLGDRVLAYVVPALDNLWASVGALWDQFKASGALDTAVGLLKNAGTAATIFFDALAGRSELGEFDGAMRTANDAGINLRDMIQRLWQKVKEFDFSALWAQIREGAANLMPALSKAGEVLGGVLQFISDHSDVLIKALPYLAAAFLAVKGAQLLNNLVGRDSLIGSTANTVATLALARSNTALAASNRALVGTTVSSTTAENASTLTRIRGTATMVAQKVATGAMTVATKAAAVGQWLLNAAMTANPIGLIIAGVLALAAAVIWAYNNVDWFKTGVDAIGAAFVWLWDKILKPYIDIFVATWTWMWENVIKPVVDFIVAYVKVMGDVYTWLWQNAIKPAIDGIVAAAKWLKDQWSEKFELLKAIVSLAVDTIKSNFQTVIDFFRDAPGEIAGFFSNIGDTLKNAGAALIDGFIQGIKDKFGSVKSTLGDLTSKLTSWKGPPTRDAKVLVNNGRLVIDSFVDGLESRFSAARDSLGALTGSLAGAAVSSVALAGAPAAVGRNYNITINTGVGDPVAIGREVSNALAAYERVNGGRR